MFQRIRHPKATFPAILLALLAFQALGWFVAWDLARIEIRQGMGQDQPASDLLDITLSTRQLAQCHVEGLEIRLGGNLYDICSAACTGDSVRLELWHDAREEALYSALGNLLAPVFSQQPVPEPAPLCVCLFQWLQSDFLLPESPALPVGRPAIAERLFCTAIPGQQIALSRPGPPPKG